MTNNILIVDFETVGYAPKEAINPALADPIQIAAVPINGKTLKMDKSKAFFSDIKPSKEFDLIDKETVKWHAENKKISVDEFKTRLEKAPAANAVWDNFLNYTKSFQLSSKDYDKPILSGHNILRYDCIILDRMKNQFGPKDKPIFHPRDIIDTMNYIFLWLESKNDVKSYSLDNLRTYFGMSKENSHDALQDCLDCGRILTRFLQWQRKWAFKTEFQGSFKDYVDD